MVFPKSQHCSPGYSSLFTQATLQKTDTFLSQSQFKFPQIKSHPWSKVFHKRLSPDALDLIGQLLVYSPETRTTGLEACSHPYFDELRDPNTRLPNGRELPPLFDFSDAELSRCSSALRMKLVPAHVANGSGGAEGDA
jgi:serine/threonine protein kinase